MAAFKRISQFFWTELEALECPVADIVRVEILHDPAELAAQGPFTLLHHPAFMFFLLRVMESPGVGPDGFGIDLVCGIVEATGSST